MESDGICITGFAIRAVWSWRKKDIDVKVRCRSLRVREEGCRAWVDDCVGVVLGELPGVTCRVVYRASPASLPSTIIIPNLHSFSNSAHYPNVYKSQAINQPAILGSHFGRQFCRKLNAASTEVPKGDRKTSRRNTQLDACDSLKPSRTYFEHKNMPSVNLARAVRH